METTITFEEDTYMFQIETEIVINAAPDAVWRVLTDFPAYPDWNPFIKEVAGDLHEGARLKVTLEQLDSKPMVFKPRIVTLEPGQRFGWLGRFLVPRLMDGEHWFELEAVGSDQTRFKQWERFGGLLVPLVRGMLQNKTKPCFELMNEALKVRVESA